MYPIPASNTRAEDASILSHWDELQSSPEALQTKSFAQDDRARVPDSRAWFVRLQTGTILSVAAQTTQRHTIKGAAQA
jgi:hypothetical protein